ncbi:MAG: DUF3943 domain-containing protein [Thermodesulfobacteriota bacterium]
MSPIKASLVKTVFVKIRMKKICSFTLIFLVFCGLVNPSFADEVTARDLYYDEYRESLLLGSFEDPASREKISAPIPREQSLGTSEFLRDTLIAYTFQWAGRWFYVRNKNSRIFDTSLSKWWDNISQWPEWDDGDNFFTNLVTHPIVGSMNYLYYRQMGHSFWVSALGSVVQSTLFEYTIEGLVERPSGSDLVFTPLLGVPLGYGLEKSSDWLEDTGFVPAKILAYIINPLKNFVHERQVGVINPFSKQFMSVSGPINFTPNKTDAIDLAYSFNLESPIPTGRFIADMQIVNVKNNLGGEFIFYSVRVDVPSADNRWGINIQIAQSGVNEIQVGDDNVSDGFEFANLEVGGKYVMTRGSNYALSAGTNLYLPTSFKDNIDRLQTVLMYRKNFPINLQSAWTVSPYLSGAMWGDIFNVIGNVSTDWVFNASKLEGNDFEFRVNYGASVGANIPVYASPVIFAEFDGYSLLTSDTEGKTSTFVSSGIRLGRKFSPGFGIQVPMSGPDSDVSKLSFFGDFQVRF